MKILYVATISLTINSFFKPHMEMLVKNGHQVDIACNYKELPLDAYYEQLGCKFHQIDFSRSPLSSDNLKAFNQLKKLVTDEKYNIVHCHTPNASVITRLVCKKLRKKTGLKVYYTAHGFHFYKGAPKLNWLVFYPVEKICSRFTDKLITINKEDFKLAKSKFKAEEVIYVPGVGVDLSEFENVKIDKSAKRQSLGVPEDAVLLTSVGELIPRKNHKIVLSALSEIKNENVHYAIVGSGTLLSELKAVAEELGISQRVHFLGYRKDIAEIYAVSDVCCLPSVHEGLPVALMEAMAAGLPAVCSRIRGSVDLIDNKGGILFESGNVDECCRAIEDVINSDMKTMGKNNKEFVKNYSVDVVINKMQIVYES